VDKPVKAIRHLPGNTSSEDITVVLQELVYDVISVKVVTVKRPTPEGGITDLSLFVVTQARNPIARAIFKLASLCNIFKKV
jgi:hypothetical protein